MVSNIRQNLARTKQMLAAAKTHPAIVCACCKKSYPYDGINKGITHMCACYIYDRNKKEGPFLCGTYGSTMTDGDMLFFRKGFKEIVKKFDTEKDILCDYCVFHMVTTFGLIQMPEKIRESYTVDSWHANRLSAHEHLKHVAAMKTFLGLRVAPTINTL